MSLLEGKVAMVTGATKTKGLGRAIAEKLAELRRQTIYMKLFHSHAGKRIAVLGVRR